MTVIQLYSVIHCQLPSQSLIQPQAAQSDNPPQASHLPFSPVCTTLTRHFCSEALEADLNLELWSLVQRPRRGTGVGDTPLFFLKVTSQENTLS